MVATTEKEREFPSDLLLNLVYCSKATSALSEDALDQLVQAAKSRNAELMVTGWLVYSHGIFFQWLEGTALVVRRLMNSVAEDSRHEDIVVLTEVEEAGERVFSGWDMELVSATDIRAVLLDAIDAAENLKSRDALRSTLAELDAQASVDNE